MKNEKNILRNLTMVLLSNILVLGSSVIVGLVVPKILGVTNFGYYKIFTLYTTYTALLHFGFVDGILLKHGADSYEDLNKLRFRLNTRFFIGMQLVIGILFLMSAFLVNNNNYSFIIGALGVYTFVSNVTTYYQFISQATMRFKELSMRKVIQAALIVLITLVLYLVSIKHNVTFKFYISLYVLVMTSLAAWYINTYRDITFGNAISIKQNFPSLISYFKQGFFMTVAYQISTLIFNMDSQYIAIFFSTHIYGLYAFAYSLIQMVLTVLNAISTVLFPHIKRQSTQQAIKLHSSAVSYILIIVFGMMVVYYPLNVIILNYLPEYAESIQFIQILFPGIGVTSCITIIVFNYFMVFEKGRIYTALSILMLIIAILVNGLSYLLFNNPFAIAASSLIVLLVWYVITEMYLGKYFNVLWKKNLIYLILMVFVFLGSVQIGTLFESLVLYVLIFAGITYLFYWTELRSILQKILNR